MTGSRTRLNYSAQLQSAAAIINDSSSIYYRVTAIGRLAINLRRVGALLAARTNQLSDLTKRDNPLFISSLLIHPLVAGAIRFLMAFNRPQIFSAKSARRSCPRKPFERGRFRSSERACLNLIPSAAYSRRGAPEL